MNFKSTVHIEDAVYVHIKGHRKVRSDDDHLRFERSEDGLALKFLEWLCLHPEIDSFPGGGSGMGSYTGWFPAEHRAAIEQFFKDQGVRPS